MNFIKIIMYIIVESLNKGHVGTRSSVLYREVSFIRRLKCTGIIGIGTSKFVLYREVFFIWSVLYRRFHCTLRTVIGVTSNICSIFTAVPKASTDKVTETLMRVERRLTATIILCSDTALGVSRVGTVANFVLIGEICSLFALEWGVALFCREACVVAVTVSLGVARRAAIDALESVSIAKIDARIAEIGAFSSTTSFAVGVTLPRDVCHCFRNSLQPKELKLNVCDVDSVFVGATGLDVEGPDTSGIFSPEHDRHERPVVVSGLFRHARIVVRSLREEN